MKTFDPSRALAVSAGLVIIALTGAAFWLSYAHLADVALAHGLGHAPERAWAWPATLDLFIVAGELLMLRAALVKRVDWWAIGLTVAGSGGSIALNVAGVGAAAEPLDYVVAAVPPTAALLAFGALMRQVHQALAERAGADTPEAVAEAALERVQVSPVTPPGVPSPPPVPASPPALAPAASPLVICGDGQVFALEAPPAPEPSGVSGDQEGRLPAKAARIVLESCWAQGTPPAEAARLATRSVSYVKKVFGRLDDERGAVHVPGQLALIAGGDA